MEKDRTAGRQEAQVFVDRQLFAEVPALATTALSGCVCHVGPWYSENRGAPTVSGRRRTWMRGAVQVQLRRVLHGEGGAPALELTA